MLSFPKFGITLCKSSKDVLQYCRNSTEVLKERKDCKNKKEMCTVNYGINMKLISSNPDNLPSAQSTVTWTPKTLQENTPQQLNGPK